MNSYPMNNKVPGSIIFAGVLCYGLAVPYFCIIHNNIDHIGFDNRHGVNGHNGNHNFVVRGELINDILKIAQRSEQPVQQYDDMPFTFFKRVARSAEFVAGPTRTRQKVFPLLVCFLTIGTTMGQWLSLPLLIVGIWLVAASRKNAAA